MTNGWGLEIGFDPANATAGVHENECNQDTSVPFAMFPCSHLSHAHAGKFSHFSLLAELQCAT